MVGLQPFLDNGVETALAWAQDGRRVAIATVMDTWGSAPRPQGAQMVIDSEAAIYGSVSGGCVEGAVIAEALEIIGQGPPRILDYGVSDENAFAVGLACGGKIKILVETVGDGVGAVPLAVLEQLAAARRQRQIVSLKLDLRDWARDVVIGPRDRGVAADIFVVEHVPPPRIVMIGAVHITQNLAPMAKLTGFDVVVIDPRPVFATQARFGDVQIIEDWPDTALAGLAPDQATAVVTLTHDAKLDDPALDVALKSDAFYIGSLGSQRTHAKRLERLREMGFGEDDLARLHGPVGVRIGAQGPAEIAVSALAQIIAAWRQGPKRASPTSSAGAVG